MRSVLTALCLFATSAHAVPAQFTHQGRLLDADGIPLEGEAIIMFRVTDSEVGGTALWEETITTSLTNGFYSAVLGADDEGNPLDTDVLSQAPVWLELQLDGEPAMFPRSAINAVPYATMATVAEELSGGPVDASQIAVDGTPVVNELGEWVGPAPTINWSDIEGMPEDFADGVDDDTDTDTDSFAALGTSCLDGDIPVWDSVLTEWTCGIDATLTADEVDAIVADNGYAMASELFSSSFLDLTDVPDGLLDGDDDTQLSEAEVDAMVADNGYAMAADAFSGLWSALTGIPDDLADGDDNTQLTADEVNAIVADNGYAVATDVDAEVAVLLTEIEALKDKVAALEEGSDSSVGTVMYGDYSVYNSVDLAGLEGFTEVTGSLYISAGDVPSLSPLSNLTRVGGALTIVNMSRVTNLSGLENLEEVGGELHISNLDLLPSLAGLESLTSVYKLRVVSNDNLESLHGLESLTSISQDLKVQGNDNLRSLEGLNGLETIGGYIYIHNNRSLESLAGMEAIHTVAQIMIINNYSLTSIEALNGVTSTGGMYDIYDNDSLCSSALDALTSILSSLGWSGYSRSEC